MKCSFGPKTRDNLLICLQELKYIGKISRRLILVRPKNNLFLSATAPMACCLVLIYF